MPTWWTIDDLPESVKEARRLPGLCQHPLRSSRSWFLEHVNLHKNQFLTQHFLHFFPIRLGGIPFPAIRSPIPDPRSIFVSRLTTKSFFGGIYFQIQPENLDRQGAITLHHFGGVIRTVAGIHIVANRLAKLNW